MLTGVIEIIVYCDDMQAQVEFYRDILGLRVAYPTGLESYAEQYWVTFDTGACTLALHGGSGREQGPDAAKFVFGTDDVDGERERLAGQIRVSEIREPAPGIRVFDGWDPEGNVFSIEAQQPG